MNKKEAIELLNHEGWTKADAQRALESINFKTDTDIDELFIRRAASQFAGAELSNRQRLQAAQKGMVTKRNQEIQSYIVQIEELTLKIGSSNGENSAELEEQVKELKDKISNLVEANDVLKKDNKHLKNIVDEIRFKLTVEIKSLLNLENILEIRKRLFELLKSTLG
ncbi:hypothetical protein [Pleurocapsa sp. FMAR1]|uniref:hypothetical protein n=1 Tax=Pleurocapsa sp. FMAR1 TaxID=3040204 RepID=UPI0029C6B9D6|nr:hypothetical protein [Pleurocapsa sp. FMAR1]